MASKLQLTKAVSTEVIQDITTHPDKWRLFLTTAANNYKYTFSDQVLIYAQKPESTACASIEYWNKIGRWVNKGTKGIALIEKLADRDRLRYVFDYSDTNSREGRTVTLWRADESMYPEISAALEDSFGTVEDPSDFISLIKDISRNMTEDNGVDYVADIKENMKDSYLLDVDESFLDTLISLGISNSVGYMMLTRLGIDADAHYDFEDFRPVLYFNTKPVITLLGTAASDIAEMGLREIESTVRSIQKNKNRTFAKPAEKEYDNVGNKRDERSPENDRDNLPSERRLFDPELDLAAAEEISPSREVRNVERNISEGTQERNLHPASDGRRTEGASVSDGYSGERDAGEPDGGYDEDSRSDGGAEAFRSDDMGGTDEQSESAGGGDNLQGADIYLTDEEPSFPSETEQQNNIKEAEADKTSAFIISQEDIDAVLLRGGIVSDGKYRIYEQFLKKESAEANIAFLKEEYGIGGSYPAVSGRDLDESHDGKGIKISRGKITNPDAEILLKWNAAAKRVGELIAADRFLSPAEKEHYPIYHAKEEARKARWAISDEFRSIVRDYNDFVEQIGEDGKKLNLYYLSACWGAFGVGDKKMHARSAEGDFILPMMREAMHTIIADNTHLTERCEAMLTALNGEIAKPFEPTYNEINPPPPPKKEYRFSLGDTIYLGAQEYEILALGDDEVRLFDAAFPIINKVIPREEFNEKIKENPLNDKFLQVVEEVPEVENTQAHITLDTGTDRVHWIYFNPDADAGGQYVAGDLDFSVFEELIEQYDIAVHPENADAFRNDLEEMSDQFLADINTPFFTEAEDDYLSDCDYIEFTAENLLKIHEDIQSFEAQRETKIVNSAPEWWDNYTALKAEYPNTVLLYRVGDFYECFGDDAKTAARVCDLVMTSRGIGGDERVAMCGFPYHVLETYTNRLVEHGYKVAVSEAEAKDTGDIAVGERNEQTEERDLPIGRIDYLHTDGRVRESVEYTSEYSFKKDIEEETFFGTPFSVTIYKDKAGGTIDRSFIDSLDPPPKGFTIEDAPYIKTESEPIDLSEEIESISDAMDKAERDNEVAESDNTPAKPYIDHYYVVEDLQAVPLEIKTFSELDKALNEYFSLPTDKVKAFGVQNTNELPGSIDFIQCRDGVDTLTEDYLKVEERAGWQNPEIIELENYLKEQIESRSVSLSPPPVQHTVRKLTTAPTVLYPEITSENRNNYRIEDDDIGVGLPHERFDNNLMAIRTLKVLEEDGKLATPEQQKFLARYVGWGGLPQYFEEDNVRYNELKELLTEEEYTAARESTLTAFFTPPVVIKAMYSALSNLGFKTGNILEPSCGIGNFMGLLPEEMSSSKMYGIELDDISGRIARQLYQNNSIAIDGYERTNLPDSFFDVAIGNVPFGQFKVGDKRYDKNNWLIHDYFFGKTIDKVRPGGVIAFITSKGTLDKENPAVRKYIAQHCELLGAIRLPNNTFKAAAGTEVTSDIIFLQKKDRIDYEEPDWVHLATDENGITMNSYFVDNPEMVCGEMKMISGPFGPESACVPYDDTPLEDLLYSAIQNIGGQITEYEVEDAEEDRDDDSIPADPSVKNFSYTLVDGKIYFRENSRMNPVDVSATALNRIKGLIGIRDAVRTLIEYQTEDYPDAEITAQQEVLNTLYDDFSKKYGLINSRANSSAFSADNSYYLLCSLEHIDEEGKYVGKADMFTKRTIKQRKQVSSVDTPSEALALSLAEKLKVDMEYMSKLTGKTEDELYEELRGVIFLNPLYSPDNTSEVQYLTADEYLSGNIREKLEWAKRSADLSPEVYGINVKALEGVMPTDLTASEISVRLGATWISPEIFEQFMFELFSTPRYSQWNIHVRYSEYTGEWQVEGKSYDKYNVKNNNTYGTTRAYGYKIFEDTLNLRDVKVFDYVEDENGTKRAVLNKKETAIAQSKQELIKQAFKDWIWADPERREQLCRIYNEKFNSIRPREYDGSHLNFVGINPEIKLREHQLNAIAHIIYGGNTLLAHVVGAGKTFEMVAAAQESKRLGLCNKAMFVVPNHIVEQFASEYLQLYPAANILVAGKKDFETRNRKKFCGRIATGDYDAVIIGHSQFEKIPMSVERQRMILQQQIDEIMAGIEEMKRVRGANFSVKQLEKTKKSVMAKLEKLNDQSRKDDIVTFEELGVDMLFVDEAHSFKNLAVFTKMKNVGGISQTEAMKSSDLYMKCRYMDEITGGRGIVFATGTPISNSMVEMFNMQRYLQFSTLQRNGLQHFDAWASTFGETVTAIELAPEGTGYRAKTRFSRFYNLPELMTMFKETADIKTADMLNLPVPKANYHSVVLKPSEYQTQMVADLSDRAERVRNRMVDSSEDNMLLITNDGRKLALDQRMINPMLPDSPTSKVSACADNVYDIWQKTAESRSTQMVFCDLSTPKSDGSFSVYNDLRDKLIAKGIPAEEIAFIHSADTEVKKLEMFKKVNSGQIRVIMGSTQKMGAGTNAQRLLIALHHLDCPWRPSDLQQREGRIIRQKNTNPEVHIYTYVTENTFDSYLYQLVESKQKFIGQIMTSKSPVRSAEDIDETALSYAEIKALCAGDDRIKEKMGLDTDVAKLKLLKASHLSQKYALEDKILKEFPQRIAALEQRIKGLETDISHLSSSTVPNEDGFCPMTIKGTLYAEKRNAGEKILSVCKSMTSPDPIPLGEYRGFEMDLSFDSFSKQYVIGLKHALKHTVPLGTDIFGNIQRLDNALADLPKNLDMCRNQLETVKAQLETAKVEVTKPFPQEEELKTKSERLAQLDAELNLDKKTNEIVDEGEVPDEPERSERHRDPER